uniref:Uncharacterized protein n=1 Tax=Arundo donax TaxID=35708 RepID=A0A0A8ZB18_ARUDO
MEKRLVSSSLLLCTIFSS